MLTDFRFLLSSLYLNPSISEYSLPHDASSTALSVLQGNNSMLPDTAVPHEASLQVRN